MWEIIEIKARKTGVVKAKGRRKDKGEVRREGKEEKSKKLKIKNDRCKESGRRVGDLEWKESGSKIREESKEVSTGTILQVDEGFWEEC